MVRLQRWCLPTGRWGNLANLEILQWDLRESLTHPQPDTPFHPKPAVICCPFSGAAPGVQLTSRFHFCSARGFCWLIVPSQRHRLLWLISHINWGPESVKYLSLYLKIFLFNSENRCTERPKVPQAGVHLQQTEVQHRQNVKASAQVLVFCSLESWCQNQVFLKEPRHVYKEIQPFLLNVALWSLKKIQSTPIALQPLLHNGKIISQVSSDNWQHLQPLKPHKHKGGPQAVPEVPHLLGTVTKLKKE